MNHQYLTDESGKPIAVVIPIQQWEALKSRIEDDSISEKEIEDAEKGWEEYLSGKGEPVKAVYDELINDTRPFDQNGTGAEPAGYPR